MSRAVFTVGYKIGFGTSGTVFYCQRGNIRCAAKKFNLNGSETYKDTIRKEISIIQTLHHRNIIQFYSWYEIDGCIYLVTDVAEGGNLVRAIEKNQVSDWPTRIRIADEIARGLEYMHQQNILHRDLKSANVLLTKHKEVKLADFGLSEYTVAMRRSSSSSRMVVGTRRWMAPELLEFSPPKYTTKSDMYALGMVMWEMAASCTKPFKDLHDELSITSHVKNGGREVLPDGTPSEYAECVLRCWEHEPHKRPEASEVTLLHGEFTSEFTSELEEDNVLSLSDVTSSNTQCSSSSIHMHSLSTTIGELSVKAEQGDEMAQVNLANFFRDQMSNHDEASMIVHRDLAAQWYLAAACKGSVEGQFSYATMLSIDMGKKLEAVKWYQKAAKQGHVMAQLKLGNIYRNGIIVDQNFVESTAWFRKAAIQGNLEAIVRLGQAYENGWGVEKNEADAVLLFRKAAENDSVEAQYLLGKMYEEGRGVSQSDAESFRWYQEAASQGHSAAQNLLAKMKSTGRGVEQNHQKTRHESQASDTIHNDFSYRTAQTHHHHGRGLSRGELVAIRYQPQSSNRKATRGKKKNPSTRRKSLPKSPAALEESHIEGFPWNHSRQP
ncbi:hypothetical protein BGW41_008375 [Actinomortierella wolfii]|nr:hypothetical protein BGW41_008375 [Actinomortierella wolfii]